MKIRMFPLVAAFLMLAGGAARADQLRLKNGKYLQGDVIAKQSDEAGVVVRLYRTGGVFRIPWNQLISEDETRLRTELGLTTVDVDTTPKIKGHRLYLTNGAVLDCLVENPDSKTGPYVVRTVTGLKSIPRKDVAKIVPIELDILLVYTPNEAFAHYTKDHPADTPSDRVKRGDYAFALGDYEDAKAEYDAALTDSDFAKSERAQMVKNRLTRVAILLKAKDATEEVAKIKRMRFRKRYDEALTALAAVEKEYQDQPEILKLLQLDQLKRQITKDRHSYYTRVVERRFFLLLRQIVDKKVRDKTVTVKDAAQWASNPKGLGEEIFSQIATDTKLSETEVRAFWADRSKYLVHHFSYGGGTFMTPAVQQKIRALMQALARSRQAARRANNRRSGRNSGNKPVVQRRVEKPKTPDEWWDGATHAEKRQFVEAWFAEFGNVLEVLRFDSTTCPNCAGKGVTISIDTTTGEEVRHICPVCNLAGEFRVVVCR